MTLNDLIWDRVFESFKIHAIALNVGVVFENFLQMKFIKNLQL